MTGLSTALTALLTGVFLVAGIGKLADRRAPALLLANLVAVTHRTAVAAVWLLAVTELSCAVVVALPGTRGVGLALAGMLGLAFVTVGAMAWHGGVTLACGCFGPATVRVRAGRPNVALGGAVLAASVLLSRAPGPPPAALPVLSAAAVATLLVFATAAWRAVHPPAGDAARARAIARTTAP